MQVHNAYNTRFPFLFCMFEKITQHLVQYFANWKTCKIYFFHEKWIHHMGGQALCACPGPLGPPPIWWIHFSWKQKLFLHLFQFAKSWIECCVTCSTMQKKSGIRVLWALWPCKKNWIHFFLSFLSMWKIEFIFY